MDNRSREAVVKAFFQTHQGESVYIPGPSQEHIVEKFEQLLPSLLESEIVFKILKDVRKISSEYCRSQQN